MSSRMLGKIDLSKFDLASEIEYLNDLPKENEEYDEFAQGYWKNISLINSSGISSDSQYRNADHARPTSYLGKCPEIQRLIETCFRPDHLRMVRARNLIAGMVVPHRDFVELDPKRQYFRIFVSLEQNGDAFHSDPSGVFQMRAGELWYLDAGVDHAAVNFSSKSRQFLCFDFVFDGPFDDLDILKPEAPFTPEVDPLYIERGSMSPSEKDDVVAALSSLLSRQTFKDLLFATSKYHFNRDVGICECYDWLIAAAERIADTAIKDKAVQLRRYLTEHRSLNERFDVNSWA
ncbi:aspartyl/asparaginyl beta-hydroxylase domain-containing protein [Rhodospirillum sp. A1_3_36]|uniref:aspartyl/asparaginyl beta-hydroxylase domain-containing protein n=1 Tax=Rhodospirillum sp. A1_3_36 TaxID=3391666 RepID=UPI0039A4581A